MADLTYYRASTGFQIVTRHDVNILKMYLYETTRNMSIQGKCDRLMEPFALRAEIHTIILWSVAHPCPTLTSHSEALDGTVALCETVWAPLSIPEGSRLYQDYFSLNFPLRNFS